MTAAASTVVARTESSRGLGATVDGTAGTTAEPLQVGAHVDNRVVAESLSPGPAVQSLTEAARASLALLRHIGGEGYIGDTDDPANNTISRASADELHAAGLIAIRHRISADIATLTEETE